VDRTGRIESKLTRDNCLTMEARFENDNVALRRIASASSAYPGSQYIPARALDNGDEGYWLCGPGQEAAWFKVMYGKE